ERAPNRRPNIRRYGLLSIARSWRRCHVVSVCYVCLFLLPRAIPASRPVPNSRLVRPRRLEGAIPARNRAVPAKSPFQPRPPLPGRRVFGFASSANRAVKLLLPISCPTWQARHAKGEVAILNDCGPPRSRCRAFGLSARTNPPPLAEPPTAWSPDRAL